MARRGIQYKEIEDENIGEALGVDGFNIEQSTEAATMAASTGSRQKYALLWQQVGRPKDKLFRSSEINQAAVDKKCKLRDEKTGKPLWYREIPAGGRPEMVEPKYKCPACQSTFGAESVESSNGSVTPGAMQLDDHVRRVHSPATYERWRPMLKKLLATVVADPTSLFVDDEDPDVAIVRDAPDVPDTPSA
jgi:hypothetical protein